MHIMVMIKFEKIVPNFYQR